MICTCVLSDAQLGPHTAHASLRVFGSLSRQPLHVCLMPPMKVCGSGTCPLKSAPEKSNPGFCRQRQHRQRHHQGTTHQPTYVIKHSSSGLCKTWSRNTVQPAQSLPSQASQRPSLPYMSTQQLYLALDCASCSSSVPHLLLVPLEHEALPVLLGREEVELVPCKRRPPSLSLHCRAE